VFQVIFCQLAGQRYGLLVVGIVGLAERAGFAAALSHQDEQADNLREVALHLPSGQLDFP
jgi:hypothetical protein